MKQINVKNLVLGSLGDSETIEIDERINNLDLIEEEKGEFVTGKVKLTRLEETILAQANLTAKVEIECNRCLKKFETDLNFNFDREYEINRTAESEENLYVDKYFQIDLGEPIREEIILATPMKVICSEECKGICPNCGKNLNNEECNCK